MHGCLRGTACYVGRRPGRSRDWTHTAAPERTAGPGTNLNGTHLGDAVTWRSRNAASRRQRRQAMYSAVAGALEQAVRDNKPSWKRRAQAGRSDQQAASPPKRRARRVARSIGGHCCSM